MARNYGYNPSSYLRGLGPLSRVSELKSEILRVLDSELKSLDEDKLDQFDPFVYYGGKDGLRSTHYHFRFRLDTELGDSLRDLRNSGYSFRVPKRIPDRATLFEFLVMALKRVLVEDGLWDNFDIYDDGTFFYLELTLDKLRAYFELGCFQGTSYPIKGYPMGEDEPPF